LGRYFKRRLVELAEKHPQVEDVRGLGLLVGMELSERRFAEILVEMSRKEGYLINRTAEKVLRFTPPLIVEKKDIDGLVEVMDKILIGIT
ncbi:MAG TPA: aminotransferase class III-fold pyridoxal phosphate-dependent enzyme, partial [Hadesarchaea archaeon]|nr:aminotransferase class III-fold pyridoxal phosphate-dependent enzyme [Hadesarchaea archaeon]